jgi:hypothetical protein
MNNIQNQMSTVQRVRCEACNTTIRKSNWSYHAKSQKHIRNTTESGKPIPKTDVKQTYCEYCNKYIRTSNWSYHIKTQIHQSNVREYYEELKSRKSRTYYTPPKSLPDKQTYKIASIPDKQTYRIASLPDKQTYKIASLPDKQTYKIASIPDKQTYRIASLPDKQAHKIALMHNTDVRNITQSYDYVYCPICNNHIQTQKYDDHLNDAQHIFNNGLLKHHDESTLKENTLTLHDYFDKVINEIIDIDENNVTLDKLIYIVDELKKRYKISTVSTCISICLMRRFGPRLSIHDYKKFHIIQLEVIDELNNYYMNRPNIVSDINIRYTGKNRARDDIIFNLYMLMPLRQSEFTNLKVISTCNDPILLSDQHNYIIIDKKLLILNKTKTEAYRQVNLKDDIINYIQTHMFDKIDDGLLCPKKRTAFNDLLNRYNTNSLQLRRYYAETYPDRIYAAQILNHKLSTHLSHYIDID